MTITSLINSYQNGDFYVSLYLDGTKVREGAGTPEYPESIDVKITDWCDAGCAWCHENSTTSGRHADLELLASVFEELPAGTELAIGGGHPLSHPGFRDFVTYLSRRGLVCNVTINEKHADDALPVLAGLVSRGIIHGIGYSYNSVPCSWKYDNLVNHVIIGITPIDDLDKITCMNKKVLLLGYKTFRRGSIYASHNQRSVEENISTWYRGLFSAAKKCHLSFDNLAIDQLNPFRLFTSSSSRDKYYMGDDGTHTMYIDGVKKLYGRNSTSKNRKCLTGDIREMFRSVRDGCAS